MIDVNCVPCLHKQASRLFEKYNIAEDRQVELKEIFEKFLTDEGVNKPSPLSAQFLNCLVKAEIGIEDLYLKEKSFYNQLLLERYSALRKEILTSDYPLKTALQLALAGNIIDFGPPQNFNLEKTLSEALSKQPGVDFSEELFKDVKSADLVLYLGDNAGEIVTDKLFIEILGHPNVFFVVRGNPVLNDVTRKDAYEIGMHEVAHVLDNGFDAPSTLMEYCSDEFKEVFFKADVVISKGQGNFEGLFGQVNHPKLYFLFMVKCEEIARVTGQERGESVILKNEISY